MEAQMKEFRESLKNVVQNIGSLVFVLDGGAWTSPQKVSDVLSRCYSEVDKLKNAFDDLNKSAGSETIDKNPDAMFGFLSACAGE